MIAAQEEKSIIKTRNEKVRVNYLKSRTLLESRLITHLPSFKSHFYHFFYVNQEELSFCIIEGGILYNDKARKSKRNKKKTATKGDYSR
jgi:hypothetical protein